MAVTMRDVAEATGVSIATVSFVVNNTKPVAPETRRRIELAVAELGYRPNRVARALAGSRTRIIALAFPAQDHRIGGAIEFITAASRYARAKDHHLVVWPVDTDGSELAELVGEHLVDGVLLMEVHLDDPRVGVLQQLGIGFALIGRTQDPAGIHCVDIDFDETVRVALDHLRDLGHTHIALMNGGREHAGLATYGPYVRYEDAYRRMAGERGMTPVTVLTAREPSSGRVAAIELLTHAPETTGVLVVDQVAAATFVDELGRQGYGVPRDMSVVSLAAAADLAEMCSPPLTGVAAPGPELGRLAVDALLRCLDGAVPLAPVLRCGPLEVRESTGLCVPRLR